MCLAIPGKVIEIDSSAKGLRMAFVDFGGITKNICIECVDIAIGDYILAHAGVALCKVDTDEALKTLEDFRTIADFIEKNDTRH